MGFKRIIVFLLIAATCAVADAGLQAGGCGAEFLQYTEVTLSVTSKRPRAVRTVQKSLASSSKRLAGCLQISNADQFVKDMAKAFDKKVRRDLKRTKDIDGAVKSVIAAFEAIISAASTGTPTDQFYLGAVDSKRGKGENPCAPDLMVTEAECMEYAKANSPYKGPRFGSFKGNFGGIRGCQWINDKNKNGWAKSVMYNTNSWNAPSQSANPVCKHA